MIIGEGISSIGIFAFHFNSIFTSVTIPNSVTFIGEGAFADCISLSEIINHATRPQKISIDVFEDVDKTACTLRVTASSVNAFRKAKVWKNFRKIEAITTN